jgi:hypothetical protein
MPGFFILLLGFVPGAQAQSTDWRIVENIPPGTEIKVTLRHGLSFGYCVLDNATDDGLVCDNEHSGAAGSLRYRRRNIKGIYLKFHSTLTGFLVGTGGGIVLGATGRVSPGWNRTSQVLFDGAAFGGLGAGIGWIVNPWVRGRCIYHSGKGSGAGNKNNVN